MKITEKFPRGRRNRINYIAGNTCHNSPQTYSTEVEEEATAGNADSGGGER
ncbi:MAG: hypothetical protein ACW964_18105 [Candidatus Hodarchaeales archaeon]|jgi:hypothetical protein